MRRLDRALERLAAQGHRSDPEIVIDRLERRLAGEPEVVALPERTTMRPPAKAQRWKGPAIAVGALAIALLIGAPILWMGRGDGDVAGNATTVASPSTSQLTTTVAPSTTVSPSTTTPPSSTTLPPETTATEIAVVLRRLTGAVFDGGSMGSIVTGGPGFVAVGPTTVAGDSMGAPTWRPQPEGGTDAWVSEDGSVWQRAESGSFGPSDTLHDVAAGPDGLLVAVGVSDMFPAIWTSRDGLTWTKLEGDPAVLGGPSRLTDVVAAGSGWVAVGEQWRWSGNEPAKPFFGMWFSADGTTWERTVQRDDPDFENAFVTELLVWRETFYAFGYAGYLGDAVMYDSVMYQAAVWTSDDGRAWTRISEDAGTGLVERPDGAPARGAWIEGATATDSYLFATGMHFDFLREPAPEWSLAVWRSEDGMTWSLLPTDFQAPGRSAHGSRLKTVAGDDNRLVAVELCTFVWASDDAGVTWHQVAELDPRNDCSAGASAMAFDGTRLVIAGWDDDTGAAVWIHDWPNGGGADGSP